MEGAEASLVTDYVLKVGFGSMFQCGIQAFFNVPVVSWVHSSQNVMQILGLDVCADTLVGDEMRRGVSGGQRKRVTTGMMSRKIIFLVRTPLGISAVF